MTLDLDAIEQHCNVSGNVTSRSTVRSLIAELRSARADVERLREFVETIALVEHVVSVGNKETCGYCGCDADEANGPITCHIEPCLQIEARKLLASLKPADGGA